MYLVKVRGLSNETEHKSRASRKCFVVGSGSCASVTLPTDPDDGGDDGTDTEEDDTNSGPAANSAPVLTAIGAKQVNEGTELTFTAIATDADGDALTFSLGTGAPTGASITSGGVFTWTPADGPATAEIQVIVSDGTATDDETITVTVNNVAPTIATFTATTDPIAVNTGVARVSGTYSDPAGAADNHTVTINWGNGATTAGTGAYGVISGSYSYAAAGVYTVSVTVTDKDNGSVSATFQFVVVYDPAAGFVTGGGWINSPAGAYVADASLSGKATFGFVSRYQKGATVPTGNTQFQFHAAGMTFKSTSYQWLVISGAKAQYKGEGTINGVSGYSFILTATDGQVTGGGGVDQFRIKITDASGVVYDNQMGAPDDAAATMALSGGSIVIHSK